jgi:hypothetical protein
MNRNTAGTAFLALLTLLLASHSFGQIIAPAYPYLILTPASPAANKDSVTVQLVLGTAGNSCMAPTFTNEKFTIVPSMLAIYPPQFGVAVTYTTVPVPPGKMCPLIYMPVQYGPVFKLGKLSLGNYNVTDAGTLAGTFSVGGMSFSNTGSTIWNGATFTTATDKAVYYLTDSLSVRYTVTNNAAMVDSFGPFGGNCIYDLIIALKGGPELYRQSTGVVCLPDIVYLTVNPGATVAHDFPKFGYPAGIETYVAALDSVVLTVSAQLWGWGGTGYDSTKASADITIKRAPSAVTSPARSRQAFSCFTAGGSLFAFVPSRQMVTLRAFTTDGRIIPGVSFRQILSAGNHYIPLKGGNDVCIVQIKGETFGTTTKMISGMGK